MAEERNAQGGIWLAAILLLSPLAFAQEEAPDMEFLEYLGSWEEDDSDWIALAEERRDDAGRDDAAARTRPEEADSDEQTN